MDGNKFFTAILFAGVIAVFLGPSFGIANEAQLKPLCPEGELFHRGLGRCLFYNSSCTNSSSFLLSRTEPPELRVGECQCQPALCNFDKLLVQWGNTKECYHLFEQGPCNLGKWLVLDNQKIPRCEKIPCFGWFSGYRPQIHGSGATKFLFPFQGKCYESFAYGFPSCTPNEVVILDSWSEDYTPICVEVPEKICVDISGDPNSEAPLHDSPSPDCSNGFVKDDSDQCVPAAFFMFRKG